MEKGELRGRRRGAETTTLVCSHSPELCGAVVPELEGDPHGSHGGVLYQGHTSQTRHQHVLLQGAQVDEWAQLPGQVAVMGKGHLLGGVCREGHGQVTATEYQLKQVVPPGGKRRFAAFNTGGGGGGGGGCPPQTKFLPLQESENT